MRQTIIRYILILPLLFSAFTSSGQKWKLLRWEYTVGLGTSHYIGDIGGATSSSYGINDVDLESTMPNFDVGVRYRLLERIAVRGNLSYVMLKGSDINSRNESRNYSFSTNLFELYGHIEYHLTKEKPYIRYSTMIIRDGLNNYNFSLNTYIFVGVGGAYSKPKAGDDFTTSTRFVDDKNWAMVIPIGIGLKYPISPTSFIGLEFGGRFTTSDYIEGFAPEASEANDIYYILQINFASKIQPHTRNKRSKFRF